jgi:hypothetical protein
LTAIYLVFLLRINWERASAVGTPGSFITVELGLKFGDEGLHPAESRGTTQTYRPFSLCRVIVREWLSHRDNDSAHDLPEKANVRSPRPCQFVSHFA